MRGRWEALKIRGQEEGGAIGGMAAEKTRDSSSREDAMPTVLLRATVANEETCCHGNKDCVCVGERGRAKQGERERGSMCVRVRESFK